jgi:hypothetical protein
MRVRVAPETSDPERGLYEGDYVIESGVQMRFTALGTINGEPEEIYEWPSVRLKAMGREGQPVLTFDARSSYFRLGDKREEKVLNGREEEA